MAYMATTTNPANAMYAAAGTPGTVLCCMCGANIAPNPANMCANCIRSQARSALALRARGRRGLLRMRS